MNAPTQFDRAQATVARALTFLACPHQIADIVADAGERGLLAHAEHAMVRAHQQHDDKALLDAARRWAFLVQGHALRIAQEEVAPASAEVG